MFYWNIFLQTNTHINQGTLINLVIVGGNGLKLSVCHNPCFSCVWSQRELWAVLHREHEYRALDVYCCYRLTYSINKLILQNMRKGKVGMGIDTVCASSSVPSKCLIYKCMYWNTAFCKVACTDLHRLRKLWFNSQRLSLQVSLRQNLMASTGVFPVWRQSFKNNHEGFWRD